MCGGRIIRDLRYVERSTPWVKTLENPADRPSQLTYLQAVRSPTAIALILANLVPLFGVLFYDWSLFTIIFCFWLESAVVGSYNIFKMVIVVNIRSISIFLVPLFVAHYGAFMSFHLGFIFALFSPDEEMSSCGGRFSGILPSADLLTSHIIDVWPAFLVLFVSHGISFFCNFIGKKEFLRSTPEKQQNAPYGRIILMHFTIILGGGLIITLGASVPALVLLIVLKIVSDVHAHLKEHGVLQGGLWDDVL